MMHWSLDPGRFGVEQHHIGAAGIVGMVLMFIVWAAVIVALVLGIRALIIHSRRNAQLATTAGTAVATDGTPAVAPETPNLLEILETRYAKGEITREEFLERKQDLNLS